MPESKKYEENPEKKPVIEFDMFVRDLDPKADENVRGGSRGSTDDNKSSK